jgi:membrane protease YdiL (CAAX protease family)
MTKAQIALTLHAALLIGALFFIVPPLTQWDTRAGFLFALGLHWLFFCLPVIGWHALRGNDGRIFSERLSWRDWWLLPALLVQVLLVALLTFVPNTSGLTQGGMYLALLISAINAPIEESAWRGGFVGTFRDRPYLGFWLGWVLSWFRYVPLALSHGMNFEGSALIFVAGFAALALFWASVAWRTGSVFYTALASFLSNFCILWVLFDRNGFAS